MGDGKPCAVGGRRRTSRRGRSWNVCQKGLLEELQTSYDSIDILQWEDDDIGDHFIFYRDFRLLNMRSFH